MNRRLGAGARGSLIGGGVGHARVAQRLTREESVRHAALIAVGAVPAEIAVAPATQRCNAPEAKQRIEPGLDAHTNTQFQEASRERRTPAQRMVTRVGRLPAIDASAVARAISGAARARSDLALAAQPDTARVRKQRAFTPLAPVPWSAPDAPRRNTREAARGLALSRERTQRRTRARATRSAQLTQSMEKKYDRSRSARMFAQEEDGAG
eukprot:2403027-Pleurochrysis_carterae.AAC.5